MPIQVNIQNGSITGGTLSKGCTFEWYNPTGNPVQLTNCGNFCTQDNYNVPANGYASAQILAMPNGLQYAFKDPAWNAGGQPHITAPTRDLDAEKEVA